MSGGEGSYCAIHKINGICLACRNEDLARFSNPDFLREVERRAGANREEMLRRISDGEMGLSYATDCLLRILGGERS